MFETVFPFVTASVISELFTKLLVRGCSQDQVMLQIHVSGSFFLLRRKQCQLITFAELGKFLINNEGGIL